MDAQVNSVQSPSFKSRFLEAWLLRRLEKLHCGRLILELPDGQRHCFTGAHSGPTAELTILHGRFFRRLLSGGDIGFAEALIDGDCESPDLTALVTLAALNEAEMGKLLMANPATKTLLRLLHQLRHNSRAGSKRNISRHYDLGNDFYAHWLDLSMTYSAGLFDSFSDDLDTAQTRKFERMANLARIQCGDHVLEIGCGWGGFALWAARSLDCRFTCVTISQAQHDWFARRIQEEGLGERIALKLQDYRDLNLKADAIVSIEMLEAVGERYWPVYFDTVKACLKPQARAALQVITIDEERYESYRRESDFIQNFVFPGGFLPSRRALSKAAAAQGLEVLEDRGYGADYARTLAFWQERFEQAWPEISALGYDEAFRRKWNYYLAYCEAGFRVRRIDLRQIALGPC